MNEDWRPQPSIRARAFGARPGVAALAAGADGTDGGHADDAAGAFIEAITLARARRIGLDPAVFLADNDGAGFFTRLGDPLVTGPTCTNINDFRVIIVGGR